MTEPLLDKLFINGMAFLSLLFYVMFSVLFWQTVVSVKRQTKNS
jgi:hypothetical protein